MTRFINRYLIQITIVVSAIILVWTSANLRWGDERWNKNLANDAKGYYAYLPAIFIYHDLSFDYLTSYSDDDPTKNRGFVHRVDPHKEHVINKYFAGTSLAQMPFFFLGHITSWALNNPLDGYSSYYLIFIQVATIFYALLGQFLLFRILYQFNISKKINTLVIFSSIFGTNIFYYITIEPGMSHVYSFAFVTLFAYGFIRFFKRPSSTYFLIGMFALGMIILIRPIDILVVLSLPFLTGSLKKLKNGFKYLYQNVGITTGGLLIAFGIVSIQLIIYKIQTGDFLVYSYAGEGFDFKDPNIVNFIISYRKGFLVYTPIFFLSILGSYTLFRRSPFGFFSLVIFLLIVIYILSSWWQWYYGGSFGSRAFIDYYVFMFIPLALWLEYGKLKKFFVPLTFVFILVCQIQTFQYQYGYIHWSDMTKEWYWDNFLRIDKVINDAEKQW